MTITDQRQAHNVFYTCVRRPLFVYRLIGLLPIVGLFSPNSENTKFITKGLYTIYCGISFLLHTICLIMIYCCLIFKESTVRTRLLRDCSELIMAIISIMVCISLFHFCKKWTLSLRKIECIELQLPPLRSREKFLRRINWFLGVMLFICTVEHITYHLYAILIVRNCSLREDDSGWYLKSYFLASTSWLYYYLPFNYTSGYVIQIIKLQSTIMIYLADTLIIVVTAYLICRVKNFYGNLLQNIKRRDDREVSWCKLQVQFTRLSTLVCTVDDLISPFILTSFLAHLLFICKEFYDILQQKRTAHMFERTECVFNHSDAPITVVYFTLSLITYLMRSSMVSLITAQLNTLSREPLNALHFVPSSKYNYEMQRLMDQVYHSKIGLSGLRFFYVTRGTVLYMISTILTYELVLIQIEE